jgi:hypothetical protein
VQLDNPGGGAEEAFGGPSTRARWRFSCGGLSVATPPIVADRQYPGIDDLQSSSAAGLAAGGSRVQLDNPGNSAERVFAEQWTRLAWPRSSDGRRSDADLRIEAAAGDWTPTAGG